MLYRTFALRTPVVVAIALAMCALGMLLVSPPASHAARVKTIAKIRGSAIEFAQDGRYMAWYSRHKTGCQLRVILYDVPKLLGQQVRCAKTQGSVATSRRHVGVNASGQVVWSEVQTGSKSIFTRVYYDTLTTNPDLLQENVYSRACKNGDRLEALALDGSSFVWTTRHFVATLDGGGDCTGDATADSGNTFNVVDLMPSVIGGVSGATMIAVRDGRFAIPENSGADIAVRNANTGAEITTVTVGGTIKWMALGGKYLVAVVDVPGGDRVMKRWNSTTGATIGSTTIDSASVGPISTNGKWVLFRKGKNIRKFRITNGSVISVATLRRTPVGGVNIDAKRAGWIQPMSSGRFAVQMVKIR